MKVTIVKSYKARLLPDGLHGSETWQYTVEYKKNTNMRTTEIVDKSGTLYKSRYEKK